VSYPADGSFEVFGVGHRATDGAAGGVCAD
jgi:hypothetical protein